jgi:hypothetical protein
MFGLFRTDPKKKLQQERERLLTRARDVLRNGDPVEAGKLHDQAEELLKQIDALDAAR